MVFASMCGSSAATSYGSDGSEWDMTAPSDLGLETRGSSLEAASPSLLRGRVAQHSIERKFREGLGGLGYGDAVIEFAVDEAIEHPQQVVRRDPEHRRAQAAERVERRHRPRRRQRPCQPIDEMDLGADRPDRSFRT